MRARRRRPSRGADQLPRVCLRVVDLRFEGPARCGVFDFERGSRRPLASARAAAASSSSFDAAARSRRRPREARRARRVTRAAASRGRQTALRGTRRAAPAACEATLRGACARFRRCLSRRAGVRAPRGRSAVRAIGLPRVAVGRVRALGALQLMVKRAAGAVPGGAVARRCLGQGTQLRSGRVELGFEIAAGAGGRLRLVQPCLELPARGLPARALGREGVGGLAHVRPGGFEPGLHLEARDRRGLRVGKAESSWVRDASQLSRSERWSSARDGARAAPPRARRAVRRPRHAARRVRPGSCRARRAHRRGRRGAGRSRRSASRSIRRASRSVRRLSRSVSFVSRSPRTVPSSARTASCRDASRRARPQALQSCVRSRRAPAAARCGSRRTGGARPRPARAHR